MRRITSLVTAAAVIASGAAAVGSAAAAPAPSAQAPVTQARGGGTYTPPSVRWGTCANSRLADAGAECGKVLVPLDYAKPRGQKIAIAVSRIKAKKGTRYLGPMLVNPGGPGGSGLTLARLGAWVPDNAGDGYDWIGFDPRGVGDSEPSLSCDGNYTEPVRPAIIPRTASIERAWRDKAAVYAKDCRKNNGAILNHLRSDNTVRDMDSIRAALGSKKISLYGFSYGTYIGQGYASRYPSHVYRFVLDGVVDASRAWYPANQDQNAAFENSMREWFAWIAKNDATFGLGTKPSVVRQRWFEIRNELAKKPRGKVGSSEWTDVFLSAGYYVYDWVHLGQLYSQAAQGDFAGVEDEYLTSNPTGPGADNGYAVYLGVQCTDARWPTQWNRWRQDAWRQHRTAPFETWGNTWFNLPCLNWPAPQGNPTKMNGAKAPAMLLIAETKDAATPFSGALATRHRFPRSVLIEGVGGTTHSGSLSGVACTDNRVAAFLKDGILPKRRSGNRADVQCDPVPQPDPNVGLRRSAPTGNPELRELLQQAQGL
ncbi:alpha/beta hydrolase [Janibacter sp. GXQ6167]|uniref:alpha/beta hydrolase n=1 Tax=Janibacter sp. GXQ6167 TaxID=3240791 RepID=UPI0035232147